MPELKVGKNIDIIFENEINKSNAHYLKALVYDYESKNIIISQTSPALTRNFINRKIVVTFLANVEKRVLRFGFSARLIDLLNNYQISSNNVVEALVLKQYDSPEQVDFRMHFRVRPPSQSNISLDKSNVDAGKKQKLIAYVEGQKIGEYSLEKESIMIGRSPLCDIRFNDNKVS
ncbi:MAG: hypothetical protein CVU52_05405, partial [Deltaproteobacteria bacterium HGW-Deltaproteobacteria-10]